MPKESAGRLVRQPQTQQRSGRGRKHVDGAFGQVEGRAARPRLQVQRRVGADQRSRIGHVHPDAAGERAGAVGRLKADRVVRRVGGGIVDGEREQAGQIAPGLVGQRGQRKRRLIGSDPQPPRVGIHLFVPGPQFEEHRVGVLRSLLAAQLPQHAAVLAAAERQRFDLAQVALVLGSGSPGAGAAQEGAPRLPLGLRRGAGRPGPGNLVGRAGDDFVRRAAEV